MRGLVVTEQNRLKRTHYTLSVFPPPHLHTRTHTYSFYLPMIFVISVTSKGQNFAQTVSKFRVYQVTPSMYWSIPPVY